MTGVDVNVSAPVKTGPDGRTYTPGDVWLAKTGSFSTTGTYTGGAEPLTVQFPGTNNFRSWNAGNVSSVEVEQTTGLVWYTERFNFIGLFDPATNSSRRWNVGGAPRDIESDGAGNAYATVGPFGGGGNEIVRINRITGVVTKWAVPGGGFQGPFGAFVSNPDGISEIDSAGRVWFAETASNEVGRLNPATNEFAEYKKVQPSTGVNTISEPQNISTSGAGALLQAFFTEGAGTAVGIVTEMEAAGTAQETKTVVPPTTPAITPTTAVHTPYDHTHLPTEKTVTPTVFDVPGVDGVPGSGATKDGAGNPIPGIIRFPFGGLDGPPPTSRATGMTQVALPNTVFGSLIGSEMMFQLTSGAIIAPPVTTPLAAAVLVIDEDSIDNGNPPNTFSARDVNDDRAEIGVRAQLRFFKENVGKVITLHTGQVGDEGWFALKTIPASWAKAGGLPGYIGNPAANPEDPPPHGTGPGLGAPDEKGDRESLLDKVPGVTPLRATALRNLVGREVCAVVYDGDVSINYGPLNGSLKGANLGTVAFAVKSVTALTGFSSSSLPKVEIEIRDAREVCRRPLVLLTDAEAPEPRSSSEPFDVAVPASPVARAGASDGAPFGPPLLMLSLMLGAVLIYRRRPPGGPT